ncbi:hypothetical protein F5Y07DRAFT_368033 [Xylaria sp. FL0933]|nr:hypothetical protein F5Y07DRAFT_368033 [Xylaria sp. FL0933]
MRPSRGHNRKRLPRNEASESSEEDVIAASNQFGVPYRDITALRTALKKLFTCKALDQEGLVILRSTSFTVVSEGLRLLFHWCDENIQTDEAQLPPTYGPTEAEAEAKIDMPSNKYGLDAQVFIYLLDRYIGSRYSSSSSLELDGWDKMVDRELGCCPLKMLSIMSTLIVVIVSKALSRCQDDTIAFAPPYIFDVAKLGIGEISRNEWGNEKLVTEFCREFEAILEDHTDYGDAIAAAVSRYVEQKWSGAAQARINEEGLGIGDGSVWNIDWSENNTQDEGPYSMENNSLNGWMC